MELKSNGRPAVSEQALLAVLQPDSEREMPGEGISRRIGGMMPQSVRPAARLLATGLVSPWQWLAAGRFASRSPLRINLGCGTLPLEGWVNVDLAGLPVDLVWDIRQPLPFQSGSVDAIFHEHVMEHIDPIHGYRLIQECYRLLKPGGVLRIVMPDASKYIHSYVDPDHAFIKQWRPKKITPMLALHSEFYHFGHRALYDYQTLELFCCTAGFQTVEQRQFGESRLTPCPDSAWRITDSFYCEAVR